MSGDEKLYDVAVFSESPQGPVYLRTLDVDISFEAAQKRAADYNEQKVSAYFFASPTPQPPWRGRKP